MFRQSNAVQKRRRRRTLVGYKIHVEYLPWEHKWRQKNHQRYKEVKRGGFHCSTSPDPRLVRSSESKSKSDHFTQRGFTLLSPVCRQLYRETALIPYKRNVWSFDSYYVMKRYVWTENRLPLLQRRAIRSLMCPFILTTTLAKHLGGIEEYIRDTQKGLEIQRIEMPKALKRGRPKKVDSYAES